MDDGTELKKLATHITTIPSTGKTERTVFTNVAGKQKHNMEQIFIHSSNSTVVTYEDIMEIPDREEVHMAYFIVHEFSKDDTAESLVHITKWLHDHPLIGKSLEYMFVYTDKANMESDLCHEIQKIFRSFTVSVRSANIYECSCLLTKLSLVPLDLVNQLLFTPVNLTSYESKELLGIQYIYYDLFLTSEKEASKLLQSIQRSTLKYMAPLKSNPAKLTNNVMFYDVYTKYCMWNPDLPLASQIKTYQDKLYKSCVNYFKRYFIEFPEKAESLLTISNDFYFQNIYLFERPYYKWIDKNKPRDVNSPAFIDFFYQDSVIKPNVLGRALHDVIKSIHTSKEALFRNPVMASLVFSPFIKSHMKYTAKRLLPFMSFATPLFRTHVIDTMEAYLGNSCLSRLPYLTSDMYKVMVANLSSQDQNELGPALSTEIRNIWFELLYQYSLYTYELLSNEIKTIDPDAEITEETITLKQRTLIDVLQEKPTLHSSLFRSGNTVVDCMVEAFFEMTMLFFDLQGDAFLYKVDTSEDAVIFIQRMRNALYTSIGVKPVTTKRAIPWLSSELVASIYNQNDIPFTISNCQDYILPILGEFHWILTSDQMDQVKLLYKWIHQFTNRGYIIPLEYYTEIFQESTLDIDLLTEQCTLRQTHVELSALHQEQTDKLEQLLSMEFDIKKREQIMNRINFLELATQSKDRSFKKIPAPDKSMWTGLLSAAEFAYEKKPNEEKKEDEEHLFCERMYELYRQRHTLFLTDAQLTTIQARLLQGLMIRTNAKAIQYAKLNAIFSQEAVYHVLNSMKLVDMPHLFLFYSMLYNWYILPHTDLMIVNSKQAAFIYNIKEHLVWLKDMKMLPESSPLLVIFSSFYSETNPETLLFHVNDAIDEYDPTALPDWIQKQVLEREMAFKEFMVPAEWFLSVSVADRTPFRTLVSEYHFLFEQNLATLSESEQIQFITTLHTTHTKAIDLRRSTPLEEAQLFLWEIQRDIEWLSWYVKHASIHELPSNIEIKCVYWILSFYLYGNFSTQLFSLLRVSSDTELPSVKPRISMIQPKLEHVLEHYDLYFPRQPTFKIVVESIRNQCQTIMGL